MLSSTLNHRTMIESDAKQQRARFYLRRPCTANAMPQMALPKMESTPVKLHLANLGDTKMFTSHGEDHVMVNRERYGRSIVVSADQVREDWNVAGFDELSEAHFAYFLALKPEVLLLGTGTQQRFAHPRLYRALTEAGIGVECMTTPAACRTYNILVAEDRKVVAAILI